MSTEFKHSTAQMNKKRKIVVWVMAELITVFLVMIVANKLIQKPRSVLLAS